MNSTFNNNNKNSWKITEFFINQIKIKKSIEISYIIAKKVPKNISTNLSKFIQTLYLLIYNSLKTNEKGFIKIKFNFTSTIIKEIFSFNIQNSIS